MLKRYCAMLLSGLSITPLMASANWTGKGELGAAQAAANTGATSMTLASKFDLADEIEQWKHAFGGSIVYTSAKEEASADDPAPTDKTSAKRWEAHQQTNYNFSPRAFWFEALRHEHDSIGSFVYQSSIGLGLGYKFIDNGDTTLTSQLGAGYKHFRTRIAASGDNDSIITAGLDMKQKLSDTAVLLDKAVLESGAANTLFQNDLAFQVKMTDVLSLSLGHQFRYNTKPGPRAFGIGNYSHTDRLLTANLVYEFK